MEDWKVFCFRQFGGMVREKRQEGRGRKGRKRTGTQPKRLDPRRERSKS